MDEQRLDRLEQKIDKLVEDVGEVKVTIAAQHVSLVEHMRRTSLLEKHLIPVIRHVAMVQGALKLISIMAAGAAIVELIIRLVK